MLCAVYKSSKKADTYLYVSRKDDFSAVPAALMNSFGKPIFVTLLAVDKRTQIAGKPVAAFKQLILEKQFYLQLPPKTEDLLSQHRASLGLNEQPDVKFN